MTSLLFAALSHLVARTRVDEVGAGDQNTTSDTPVDEFGGNPAPTPLVPEADRLPDPELRLNDKEAGTIEYETTTGSGT